MISPDRLPYVILMIFATVVCAAISVFTFQSRRKVARAASFSMMAICASFWMILLTADLLASGLFIKEILWRLTPFAMLNTLLGLFFFSMQFSFRMKRIPRVVLYATTAVVLAVAALSATNHLHHQMWTSAQIDGYVIQVMGRLYGIQLAYTYLLATASFIFLFRAFLRSKGLLRRQTVLLMTGILVPILVSITSDVFGWNPLPLVDEPGLSMVLTVILFGWATLGFEAFYLLPVASDVIIRNMLDGVLVTDVDGLIIFSNEAARAVFGKSELQMNGRATDEILSDWSSEALRAWEGKKEETQLITRGDVPRFYRMTISSLEGNSGEAIGTLLLIYDITAQKNAEKQLNELAICDPLTGAYNRRYFYEMASIYYNQMLRSAKPLSVLMIDLDHFKQINDMHGHVIGDQALQKVTATCKRMVRSQDIFSRFGGEEFVLAMPETPLQVAVMVAERLCREIEALKNEFDGIAITASIGIEETAGNNGPTLDALLARADEAMYLSKKAGRNCVTVWKKN